MTRMGCLSGIGVIIWSVFFTWMAMGLPDIIPDPMQLQVAAIIGMILITLVEAMLILVCFYFVLHKHR